ncbi:MAG: sigma-54-dependent Fis family transcriptional regulator [Alphaproteobacteria bacterium]|nr:sigma-54-dependent Fis family transcriptional regulator [Alphaproteobacteria bacterium]MCB9697704.1 sigma-54-dependent Fis family transcriptional regulator [Alphaproteobacteria bacterium]
MNGRGKLLILDDDQDLCDLLTRGASRRGFETTATTDPSAGLELLGELDPDVVLTDLNMGRMDGLEVCRRVVERRPGTPVVVLTAFGSMESAVAAIRAGAYDFLAKPVDLDALALALDRAVQHRRLTDEVRRLRAAARTAPKLDDLVGDSAPMRALFDLVARVAPTDSSVLVHGESGTGKELVAQAIHAHSRRATGPFVAINCAAVPENLLESELFGHVRGAFTDAKGGRPGLFVRAHRGTLFLDEIGDLPLPLQVKLLRVLQERKVRPVGSDEEVGIDVRVVSATHRDVDEMVDQARFRADLLYRLDVIRVEVPPLRARGNDVLLLAQRFVEQFAAREGKAVTGIAQPAAQRIRDYDWPGNVRELQNCIERAVALTTFDRLTVDDLPPRVAKHQPTERVVVAASDPAALLPLDEVERRYIQQVMDTVKGNKALAARILGLDRKTLYRKLGKEPGAE